MLLMAKQRKKKMLEARKKKARTDRSTDPNTFNGKNRYSSFLNVYTYS